VKAAAKVGSKDHNTRIARRIILAFVTIEIVSQSYASKQRSGKPHSQTSLSLMLSPTDDV